MSSTAFTDVFRSQLMVQGESRYLEAARRAGCLASGVACRYWYISFQTQPEHPSGQSTSRA